MKYSIMRVTPETASSPAAVANHRSAARPIA
jgi:hypothetical protein